MQSEWPIVPVADCCDLIVDCVNKTAPVVESATPFKMIRTTNVRNGFIDLSDCKFVDEATFQTWTRRAAVLDGDVVLTREAPIGEVGLVRGNPKIFLGQRLMQYRANRSLLDPRYLCYAFLSPQLQHQFGAHEGSGSVVSHIRVGDCSKFMVPLPPLSVQRSIAELLGSIDERVLLLRQTNATLESIAQALFKSWFIDFDPVRAKAEGREPEGMDAATAALFPAEFEESALGLIPKGWCLGKLDAICTNPRNQAKPGQIPSDTPYIGLEHMPRKSIALDSAGTAEGLESGKFWFERNDVLFGKLRPYFHKVGLAPIRGVCSTDILVLRPKQQDWLGFLTMHLSSEALITYATQLSNGARMPRTSWQDVGGFALALPSPSIAAAFNAFVRPMFDRIYANIDAVRVLADLRDTLLPRLISGKLRLPEAQAMVESGA